jgi:H+/Cl- antiporter ClcA
MAVESTQINSPKMNFTVSGILKWLILCCAIGLLSGTSSAIFLLSLDYVSQLQNKIPGIYFSLPLGGLFIGYMYFRGPKEASDGNNTIFKEFKNGNSKISILMAPMVYLGTLITHFLGGSAGREGTAVQMSTSIADQFSRFVNFNSTDRKILLCIGISGGFASVFGTPIAGAIFALEILTFQKFPYKFIIPSFITALIAHFCCTHFLNVEHSEYHLFSHTPITINNLLLIILASISFGFAAQLFAFFANLFSTFAKAITQNNVIKPVIGGLILVVLYTAFNCKAYYGLGLKGIETSFFIPLRDMNFLIKIILTSFTLAFGFKGGEVTPLFYIGATLGNYLFQWVPLPLDLLAALGFVAVFAGATHSVFASSAMAFELFGIEHLHYFIIACFIANLFSGKHGIYESQDSFMQKIKFPSIEKLLKLRN